MLNNFDDSLELVLKSEGGFVDNPIDPGGMTNLGVTKAVWEAWVGHPVDEKVMRNLTPEYVAPMYKSKFWNQCFGDDLPKGLDYAVFDFAVNAGPGRSIKTLQQAIGCVPDGSIGPRTMGEIHNSDVRKVLEDFCAARLDFYQGLKTFPVFGKGWSKRVEDVKSNALEMIG
jgi:lysozyme family protein